MTDTATPTDKMIGHAEVEALANELIAQYLDDSWSFRFDKAFRTVGSCDHRNHVISMSRILTESISWAVADETLRHEIAHALLPYWRSGVDSKGRRRRQGHSPEWRAMALSIGSNGKRCAERGEVIDVPAKPRKWVGECPECGHRTRPQRIRRRVACTKCCVAFNGGKFDEAFLFVWEDTSS
jgi:predicted SprT family Zn-dependent metalloprotease